MGCLPTDQGVRYPLCLEGERACPPDDVGGVDGYEEFLAAIADASHSEHYPPTGLLCTFSQERSNRSEPMCEIAIGQWSEFTRRKDPSERKPWEGLIDSERVVI